METNNDKEIINRLKAVQSCKSYSVRQFALSIGCKQNTIDNQLKERRAISLDTIIAVLSTYKDISPDWLLHGEGTMLRTSGGTYNLTQAKIDGSAIGVGNIVGNSSSDDIDKLKKENEELRQENKEVRKRCDMLTDKLLSL